MRLLNVGCGDHYHPEWTNIDIQPNSSDVIAHDIRKGLPFSDSTCDAVYHSHVIEHMPPEGSQHFLRECVRVLKKGGILRVATPDLETIARAYIRTVDMATTRDSLVDDDYDWIMLELFDQMVRDHPGGRMGEYLNSGKNKDFVLSRIGHEAHQYWMKRASTPIPLWEKARKAGFRRLYGRSRKRAALFMVGLIAGKETKHACEVGLFRNSGEIHLWLYDRYSLKRSLTSAGLTEIRICPADESRIPSFNSFGLDMIDGKTRKPDSIFMEGEKR